MEGVRAGETHAERDRPECRTLGGGRTGRGLTQGRENYRVTCVEGTRIRLRHGGVQNTDQGHSVTYGDTLKTRNRDTMR